MVASTRIHLAMLVAAAALLRPSVAATYVVGDSLGWIVPPGGPIAYETWAAMHSFEVGDVLEFNFTTGDQDLARVTKEAFDACNSSNPIFLQTTGPYNYTLSTAGEYYFIGTMDRHCFLGQKLAINVTAAGSSPSPSSSVPPSRVSNTYVVGDDLGWIVPPGGEIAYKTWAYDKTFLVGDKLVFNFENGTQDVVEVTKDSYDSCNTSAPISVETISPAVITLASAGEHFYTSSYSRHCALGQKLAINVTSTSTGEAPCPSSIAGPPSSNPSPSAQSPTAGGPSSTVPKNTAQGGAKLGMGFSLAIMGVALGLVH
ncbi:hypothetical protein MLD38_006816 [Melastoma candidum]|uniref:Uncharacterized protein n=1 Tax=Melastoma candidum TaxID=119954 RepID=A0ACB9RP83_9MYRT|nr:hypothetical protein MLD38_006816 [Melastoma candidum]